MNKYGNKPLPISEIKVDNLEMYYYQYLPISMIDQRVILIPEQLGRLKEIILKVIIDFERTGKQKLEDYYVYITAKSMYVKKDSNLNREGWHSDGFMTDDVNYIWSDSLPTEFIEGEFYNIPQDHNKSMELFGVIASENEIKTCSPNVIYRLDQSVIHRCAINEGEAFLRHFVKISFSKEKYNLKGNSHNYRIKYEWEMKERNPERNHPNK